MNSPHLAASCRNAGDACGRATGACVCVCVCVQLLARHSELEQSETKAQAALVMILCFTQITELKLLLDIGRQGHRFYDFVLTMLVACISLEIFVGVVIMYIGNLHYYRSSSGSGGGDDDRGASRRRGTRPFRRVNRVPAPGVRAGLAGDAGPEWVAGKHQGIRNALFEIFDN